MRLDDDTIQRIEKNAVKIHSVHTYHLLPDGTLLRLVHVFKPDGAIAGDETQFFRRK